MNISYNVTGVRRRELVRAISEKIGREASYLGMPSTAFEIGPITVDRNGGLTWDDRITDSEIEYLIEQLSELGFEATVENPVPEDEDRLEVSFPVDYLDQAARARLNAIIKAKGSLIKKAISADDLPILYGQGKIIFPWFRGDTLLNDGPTYSQFIAKLCEYAKNLKRVNATEKEVVNEKYAFRCFLLRLGFIGREYKTARKILLRNLTGSSAFRDGKKEAE